MKKLLATILALVMALPLCTVSWAAETQDVAEAGGTKYESLQDAINAADGQTVKLLDNVTVVGSVTEIPAGTKVTLDLNGKTLTGTNTPTKEQALLVNGELVIVDSSEAKTGTIKSDYADGTGVKPKLWMSKDNFELPTPTRSGYTFKGWKIALHEGEQIPGFTGTYTSEQVKDIVFAEAATDGGAINRFSDGAYLTAVWSANSYYYYPSTSDTTTSTTTKGSPKTFDAGVGIYAVTAVLSVTGMAWTAKKRH